MREAAREILDDLPDALLTALSVGMFIGGLAVWLAVRAGA